MDWTSIAVVGCQLGYAWASSVVVGHPLDTVKTRLQAGKGYKSTMHCIVTTYRKEAAAGFFKGMSFPVATIAAYNSLVFGFFSNAQRSICKRRYGDERHPAGLVDVAAASMLTGLVSVSLGAPIDLVKIRLQMQTAGRAESFQLAGSMSSHGVTAAPAGARSLHVANSAGGAINVYRGPVHCINSIVQREGLRGLYRGGVAMLLRDIPGYALYFVPYAVFCDLLKSDGATAPHPCAIWLAGGLAGAISWVTATPADVVKSRLQADAHLHRKYNGVLHCILHSYKTEGVQVFFRGASVNAIRGFPMSATMFLGYELSLQFFQRF
ncbi:solute carrier family 25 member 48 isoform X2 [Corythoichthys intestinalis]|uniref:solute carrier family 25 member 48 isoform X2 n=1 Tax=Corythoichthys intestinalis TaxID=161448 RepID=UPI0025A65FCC|nr:solute carrier family 25 member 48 isoform X2 [Corythoichthys intestinalis]